MFYSADAKHCIHNLFSFLNQNAKDRAGAVLDQLHGAKSEMKALRSMTQRMVLTQKEMVCTCILPRTLSIIIWKLNCITISTFQEEVVLKRCWLARHWGLAARHGNHVTIVSMHPLLTLFLERNNRPFMI